VTTAGASVAVVGTAGVVNIVITTGTDGREAGVGEPGADNAVPVADSGTGTVTVGVSDGHGEVMVMMWTD
jgi:hypothetical protein